MSRLKILLQLERGVRKQDTLSASLARSVALLLVFGLSSLEAAEYRGKVIKIADGDTFTVHANSRNVRVRLCGVDSPERGERGYHPARAALTGLLIGKAVHCVQVGSGTPCDGRSGARSRDRIVAQCFVGDLDIAVEMVRSGDACDWPKFSAGHYRINASTCINPK